MRPHPTRDGTAAATPTARTLIARRARILKLQVGVAIGGMLGVAVLQFRPVPLHMTKAAFTTDAAVPWWPWLFLPVATYLLGAAATAVLTGRMIWPLNWVAALALRDVDDTPAPSCARHDGYDVHDDVFTPEDCTPGCPGGDACSVCGGDHDRVSRDDAPACWDATHGASR